ncbi:phospholipase D1-like protein [Sarcoptes scabiei]|uniref:Phospholipase n=1 Tax=Sarcoptes scabiei TaxID=52283 RepID=A0A132AB08_SARSC|nr:phospholipase D1-like protein [Sarcoptes scabiei]
MDSKRKKSLKHQSSISLTTSLKQRNVRIPYTKIFDPDHNIFLDDLPIEAKIINYEETKFLLSPYIYHIELNHGNFNWIIKRRFHQFRQLHNQIWLHYTKLIIPLPTQHSRQNRKLLEEIGEIEWPKFPVLPETFLIAEGISKRIKILEDYLRFLLDLVIFRRHPALLNFLAISPYSFIEELGLKGEEVLVKKRAGGFRSASCCVRIENFFTDLTGHWRKRWLVVKDTCLFYLYPEDHKIRYVMLFDPEFYADSGIKVTGIANGLRIRNLSRQLILKCQNEKRAKELAEYLNEYSKKNAKDFVHRNRFGSFVPPRKSQFCQWFVDGCAYFEAVSQAIETAQQEIYITDWWLSPEIYLQRPSLGLDYRLDRLLLKKAQNGVKIFILLYKEMEIGISINSIYTKRTLMRMHQNISVLRHPDAVRGGPLLWSHHEKLVVIDQKIAFVGGIDLCFGRWDNYEHRLTDLGGIFFQTAHKNDLIHSSIRPTGLLYRSVSQPMLDDSVQSEAEKNTPRHITKPSMLLQIGGDSFETRSVADLEDVKNNNSLFDEDDKENLDTIDEIDCGEKIDESVTNTTATNTLTNNTASNKSSNLRGKIRKHLLDKRARALAVRAAKLWIGKDYTNFIVKDFTQLDLPFQDSVDRNNTPRMPWHDVSCVVVGQAASDVARHFIQRWNHTKFSKAKFKQRYPWLIPKSLRCFAATDELPSYLTRAHKVDCQIVCCPYLFKMFVSGLIVHFFRKVRSVGPWSIGIRDTEASIVDAYIEAINQAEHYIYIENQFFISQTKTHLSSNDGVKNRIAEALYRRILRAFRNRKTFRVYVLIPLLPAFEGEVGTTSGAAIQQITHYNYSTIIKGYDSLMSKLKLEIEDLDQYIGFYSLRNFDKLNERLITELVYIHSKIMIVDDRISLIGSANINDRSMLGNRDSEVVIFVEDQEYEFYYMDQKPYKSGKFSGSLRRMLMREHLGIYKVNKKEMLRMSDEVNDPISEHFWSEIWNKIAQKNTEIYETVFPVIPSDQIKRLDEIGAYMEQKKLYKHNIEKAEELLSEIKGHLVKLPLQFLIDEPNLNSNYSAQDHFIPQIVWT